MHAALNTSLTQVLGCDYPVIQTAMGWVSTSQLVMASIQAGAFGFLAAAVMSPDECEEEIKLIKSKTDKPFGVNIHAFQPGIDKIIDMCIDYDVAALSYGRGPSPKIVEKVKAVGIKCVPTIGASKHASKAVKMGADILVCQGQEGGGRGLAAALTFGADGIAMGTRFMMSADSPTPDVTKAEYIKSDVLKIPVSTKLDGLPQRMILNNTLDDLEKSSKLGMLIRAMQNGMKYKSQTGMSITQTIKTAWNMARKTDMTLGQTMMAGNAPMIIQKAMVEGRPDEGVLPSGQIAGLIDDLPTCLEIVSQIVSEADVRLKKIGA